MADKVLALKRSWVQYDTNTHFPIQNLPYGVFEHPNGKTPTIGVAIGDQILDLHLLAKQNLLPKSSNDTFLSKTLNDFMSLTPSIWHETRARISSLLEENGSSDLRSNSILCQSALIPQSSVKMLLPAVIGDYTDFYSSREHATNVGIMFRGKDNALQPNWLHLPVGYHGRSSTVVISNTDIRRPIGQLTPDDATPPSLGPCRLFDFELEVACFLGGPSNALGDRITIENAESRIFGVVLMNDWSARDIQRWEYVPLGPFTAKNFATSISPWIVTLEALEPFKVSGPDQSTPQVLSYLQDSKPGGYDIHLSVELETEKGGKKVLSETNFKGMYWSMKQQLVHHSVTGCVMRAGDLLGSGTVSGKEDTSLGSMLEISWKGTRSVKMDGTGEERKFLADGDKVVMKGQCKGHGFRIGFGECSGKVLPAKTQ